ncbi:MAG: EamA family transporter [Gemmatimonadales bacterium]
MTDGARRTRTFWAFAAIYIIWGSTYLAIQVAIGTMPPFTLAASRFLLAGAVLYLWGRLRGEADPGPAVWRDAFLFGTLFFVIGNGLVVWAEQHVPSGRTALLTSTSPIWMVVFESALAGWQRPPKRVIVGLVLGIVGLSILATPRPGAGGEAIAASGIAALVFAAAGWAAGSVWSHHHHLRGSPVMTTGMKMLGGGAQLGLLALVSGEEHRTSVGQISAASWLALGYLVVFGSIIGFSAFTYLLRTTTPAVVGTSAYVNPLVAVFLGWALAGEVVTSRMMLGAGVSLLGVLLIRWPVPVVPPPAEVEVGTIETGEFPVPNEPR